MGLNPPPIPPIDPGENNGSEVDNNAISSSLTEIGRRLENIENSFQGLKNKVDGCSTFNNAISAKLQSMEEALGRFTAQAGALTQEQADALIEVKQNVKAVPDIPSKINAAQDSIETEVGAMSTDVTSISGKVEAVAKNVNTISKNVSSISEKVNSVSQQMGNTLGGISSISTRIENIPEKISEAKNVTSKKLSEISDQIEELSEISDQIEELSEIPDQIDDLKTSLLVIPERLVKGADNLEKKANEIVRKVDNALAASEKLSTATNAINDAIDTLSGSTESLNKSADALSDSADELVGNIVEGVENCTNKLATSSALESGIKKVSEEVSSSSSSSISKLGVRTAFAITAAIMLLLSSMFFVGAFSLHSWNWLVVTSLTLLLVSVVANVIFDFICMRGELTTIIVVMAFVWFLSTFVFSLTAFLS